MVKGLSLDHFSPFALPFAALFFFLTLPLASTNPFFAELSNRTPLHLLWETTPLAFSFLTFAFDLLFRMDWSAIYSHL